MIFSTSFFPYMDITYFKVFFNYKEIYAENLYFYSYLIV